MKFVGSCRPLTGVPPVMGEAASRVFGLTDPPHDEEGLTDRPLLPSRGRGRSRCLILAVFNSQMLASRNASPLLGGAKLRPPSAQGLLIALSLALHKIKKSQVRTKRKVQSKHGRQVPLEKFLRIRRPATARKKSFSKNFNLESQFRGALSLDLLFLFSGPFIDLIACPMNFRMGRNLSSLMK
ncbi:hypothetical protein Cgig2_017860 [Carnegiea gigantea]|uniref:Uncharacterized protein n=1 Tax=Carnegiea gigantea TaxID=171969 RepID=A0A9Q1QRH3_9CARY|nr:hypothetical protein Cgig2_017860 [Carnegiea gigantea]